jgi:putative transposase
VVPGQAWHIVQRGNNRQPVFFADVDYRYYLDCLSESAQRFGCAIHAYEWFGVRVKTHLILRLSSFSYGFVIVV